MQNLKTAHLTSHTIRSFSKNSVVPLQQIHFAITELESMEIALGDLTSIICSTDFQYVLATDAKTNPNDIPVKLAKLCDQLGAKVTSILETLQKIQSPT